MNSYFFSSLLPASSFSSRVPRVQGGSSHDFQIKPRMEMWTESARTGDVIGYPLPGNEMMKARLRLGPP